MLLSLRESSKSHNNSLPYRPFDLMDSAAYAAFQEKTKWKKVWESRDGGEFNSWGHCCSWWERHTFFFFFFFFFFKATTFDYPTLNSTSVHCLWSHKFHFFIKYWSFDTIYTFKNYFTTVFSVFSKNKLYLSRNFFYLFF